ncbi:RidA family protein [Cryptosporangium arvum]|uniref:Putative translation initiation inhibitor, yjgF family n=1 Tax=Cryptosporangium arvum DSM 44712 TaxID=927661 RepID=A0A010ZL53_9ACTN|nr:Rid family hydrolase [Cryptosporangium arvum]EXG79379.1 putative translation initiation inhibitor, yjgF family [Cryptosporangium arvum DSM 44712]
MSEPRRRPDPLTDPLGALESPDPLGGERPSRRERRASFGDPDEITPGRAVARREDPSRGAAREGRRSHSDELERPRRVPQQRRPEPADDEYDGRVLPRRPDRPRGADDSLRRSGEITDRPRSAPDPGERPRRSIDAPDRPRGVADTGDRMRRSGEITDRPRGSADTGDHLRRSGEITDRPRGVSDTGERARTAARASVPVAGRAVVGEPMRPDAAQRTSGRIVSVPERARSARSAPAVSRTPTGEPEAIRRINPFDLPAPRGYSHATIATGQLVFLAAQCGVDLDGRIVDGGLVSQFDRAVQNLLSALAAAGGSAEHLVSITVQVTSIDDYKASSRPIGHVWRARLGGLMPALSVSEVRRFWDAEAEIQIAAQAVLP